MSLWGGARLFCCIFFISCCYTVTFAQVPVDCCFAVRNKTIEKCFVVDYRQQIRGQGCPLDATVIITRKGFKLCVPADEVWVHDVMKHANRLKRHCKKNNYKGKRCIGVSMSE